ncbi:hypothetical protein [Stutzerimonas urumqiensis]|uniref:hypothetical protein n=1 Tax=Stutzerimonas urumqiensis TaxID=638269 RepID=UPI000EB1D090|nr:hypothetical protein [Stutzerimonas urumqiensis]
MAQCLRPVRRELVAQSDTGVAHSSREDFGRQGPEHSGHRRLKSTETNQSGERDPPDTLGIQQLEIRHDIQGDAEDAGDVYLFAADFVGSHPITGIISEATSAPIITAFSAITFSRCATDLPQTILVLPAFNA